MGRSFCVSRSRPCRNVDPAISSSIAGLESQSSKVQGFADHDNQSAFSQHLKVPLTRRT